MRREFVQRIDPAKAYTYFRRTEGWTKRDVDQQVLTPLSNASIFRTAPAVGWPPLGAAGAAGGAVTPFSMTFA